MAVFALLIAAGCGEEEGVGEGAVASVYVAAPLCAEAKGEAGRSGNRAGELRVRVVCLPDAEGGGRIDLAGIGAGARRAVEDSSTVGYIGDPTPAATRFSRPILESAEVPQLSDLSGAAAMKKLLKAIQSADTSGSLRQSVGDELR